MRTYLSVALVAAVLAATVAVAIVLYSGSVDQIRTAERASAQEATHELEKTLQATSFRLRGVAGLFEASQEVSSAEFRSFSEPLFGEQRALNGVLWLPRITDRRRPAYERANRPITEGPVSARRAAAHRAAYFPVTYLESQSSVRALGFDGGSEPSRRIAIQRSIQTARAQATEPVKLAASGRAGVLLYQPVFTAHAVPATGLARMSDVQGVVAGSYRIDELLVSLRSGLPDGTRLQVREDGAQISGPRDMDGGETSRVDVVGRHWSVRARSNQSPSLAAPGAVLAAGATLALLLALMLRQAFTREGYALSIVDARMRERDAAQSELERARVTAQALAAEQTSLRRVATSIAAEEPLATIRETLRAELCRLFDADDVAIVRGGPGREVSLDAPDWLTHDTGRSIVRSDIRIGGAPQGLIALLNPDERHREVVDDGLRDFADLASVAISTSEARHELATRATTDGLTGVLNRRAFDDQLQKEISRSLRHERALTLAIIDIDHFKSVNDCHGHLTGDAVLTAVAHELSDRARTGDTVARVGGEEFAWIMPETPLSEAFGAAERIRTIIAGTDHAGVAGLTISIGMSDLGDAATSDALYGRADGALYEAKNTGRNRTVRARETARH